MTKTEHKKNVLNNLRTIHSLQVNGDILSLLRDLRENKIQVDSFIKSLNVRIKEINFEKEEQNRISSEKLEKEKIKVEETIFSDSNKTKSLDDESASHLASSSDVREDNAITGKSQSIAVSNETQPQQNEIKIQKADTGEQKEKQYDRKRTFDVSKQNQPYKKEFNQDRFKSGDRFQNQNTGFQKSYQKGKEGFQKNFQGGYQRNYGASKPYSNTYEKRTFPNTNYKKFGDKGYDSRQQNQNKPAFASTRVNNFKDFGQPNLIIEKERSFGAKNKSHYNKYNDNYKTSNQPNKRQTSRRCFLDANLEVEERRVSRKINRPKKKENVFVAPSVEKAIMTTENISLKNLSEKIGKPVPDIMKKLMILGVMATINSSIDYATAELVSSELGVVLEQKIEKTYEEKLLDVSKLEEDEEGAKPRPPVVTVMGHVDHGKTSLLDVIRKANVANDEAGGITQRIGAYSVSSKNGKITFIDTPGHAAFTSMRSRGAKITDLAILVVAADDGVMPQTIEAINHIKAAEVPMIVAINKMDSNDANPERIKTQLAANGVLPEEWGGDAVIVPVSAKTGVGIPELINMILLVAEMQGLKANPDKMAVGTVIEATLDKNKGPVATVLVQNGTLRVGNTIMSGITFGNVKAMYDENGKSVKEALPSTPVAVLGFNEVPDSGDQVFAVSEKLSKQIIDERKTKIKEERALTTTGVTLDNFMSKVQESKLKVLNIIIKADVQGSVEALKQSLTAIANEEVKVACIHSGVGPITESDLVLAKTSNALIVNFNLKIQSKIQSMADNLGIEIRPYKIIYEVVDDITKAITGMLSKKYEQRTSGHAEVRKVFKLSTSGLIAGSYVTDGKIIRGAMARLIRDGEIIEDVEITALKIVKDDKSEVSYGFECGIKLKDVDNVKEGDIIEC
ncbi:MAG: translation initiation factor IF-2, partial [Clostridia bacterium]|nr:translation initiation factor IF-2 [Clostridia bacterium]